MKSEKKSLYMFVKLLFTWLKRTVLNLEFDIY